MKFLNTLSFVLSLATALPSEGHHYKRQLGDIRSPCPALNTLANHGFIARNGRAIPIDQINTAIQSVYGIDPTFGLLFSRVGSVLVSNSTLDGLLRPTADLSDFDVHNGIEHDASLSRADVSEGDGISLQPGLVELLMSDSMTDVLSVESLARSRVRREKDSAGRGLPPLDGKSVFIAYGEAALILETFASGSDGNGPTAGKEAVRTWLMEERLPDGYTKPSVPISLDATVALSNKIQDAAKRMR